MEGLGFMVSSRGFRVMVFSEGFRFYGFQWRVQVLWLSVKGLGFMVFSGGFMVASRWFGAYRF